MTIACFWIEPSQFCQVRYRKFTFDSNARCPSRPRPGLGHEAVRSVDRHLIPVVWMCDGDRIGGLNQGPSAIQSVDPRWPTHCDLCDGPFPTDNVHWQVSSEQLYLMPDGGLIELAQAPVGAMWHAFWADDIHTGPDGRAIEVMTPGGRWCIDTHRAGQRIWTRTGEPPNLTVTPSINCTGVSPYHGWLRNGQLEPA